jgi:hypothetical protein
VARAGRDEDGVAGADFAFNAVDFHKGGSFEKEVDFFCEEVAVALGGDALREGGFGEALVLDRGIRVVEDFANGGAVFGGESGLGGEGVEGHGWWGWWRVSIVWGVPALTSRALLVESLVVRG